MNRAPRPEETSRSASSRQAAVWSAFPPLRSLLRLLLLLPVASCGRGEDITPPVVLFGEHECDVCRMIISDDRFAASALRLDARGRTEPVRFDDIGCLLEYERLPGVPPLLARWVSDQATTRWIDADTAYYVHSRLIHTPMAFGLAAFGDPDDADALRRATDGTGMTLDTARALHAAGRLAIPWLDDATDDPSDAEDAGHERHRPAGMTGSRP